MSESKSQKFPIDAAQIVGLFMERIFLVTFVRCIRHLLWSEGHLKPLRTLHWKMIMAAVAMFIFASLDVAFHLRHNLDAFVEFEGDPIDEFNKTQSWINVMKMGCYVAQTFVGDAILLYRCWIVYNRKWLIMVLPVVLWLGCTVCGAMTVYVQATLDTAGKLLNASSLVPFITSMLCLTLIMNVLTTGLIVHRILGVQRELKNRDTLVLDSPLSRVVVVMMESGCIYTVSIVVLFGLYMAGNNGQYGVSNAVVQIIGITFNLIITSADRKQDSTISHVMSSSGNGLPLHRINIHTTISRDVERDPDLDDIVFKSRPNSDATSPTSRKEWRSSGPHLE